MTGIAGILAQEEADIAAKIQTLFSAMENRGSITETVSIKRSEGTVAIGYCSHSDGASLASRLAETSVVVDGQLPPSIALEEIGGQADDQSLSESIRASGAFSAISISAGRLLAIRDVLGQKPLYYGIDLEGTIAFASLMNALQSIGIRNPISVPPGKLIASSGGKPTVVADGSLTRPKEIRVSEREASTRLKALLIDSLSDSVPKDLALAFSGGLDSTLVAQAAKENDLRPELVTVGMKGQPELKHASEISKRLDLDVNVRELTQTEVFDSLPTVVQTVGTSDPTIVGVSIPLFFVCEVAREMGVGCILAGQLSDELFAGYGRFDELARKGNPRMAREEVWRSVLAASTNDFEPGDKLAVSHHLELRCPFAFLPLVEYALRLPMSLKLKIERGKVLRKYILRRLAADWNLPRTVVDRPKKAVQYSSGIQKILLKEAKKRHLSLSDFLGNPQNW